jgi:hypothetical protein
MQMVGQHDPGVNPKGPLGHGRPDGGAKGRNLIDQKA